MPFDITHSPREEGAGVSAHSRCWLGVGGGPPDERRPAPIPASAVRTLTCSRLGPG